MATEKTAPKMPEEQGDWRKRETFLGFLRDVVIAAVILAIGFWLYYRHEQTGRQVRELGKQAKEYMLKDSAPAYAQAEKRLLEMVELDSDYPFALASLGELYATRWIDQGIDSEAGNAQKWAKLADETDARINERYGAVLMVMIGEKKYEEAHKYASEITKKAASSHVVHGLGRALRGMGRLDEARIALKKSADTEWRNPRFACDYADLFFEDGDYINAANFYTKGIEASADHARSLIGRSRAQIARGNKIKEATDTLAAVGARPPESFTPRLKAQYLTAMAELKTFEQNLEEAGKFADEAIAASATYPWAHFAKGRVLALAKNAPGAAASFDKAIELDKFVPEFYYTGSNFVFEAGDPAKAQAMLDAFAKVLKEDDRFHLAYGNLLMKLAKPDEALEHYEKAIAMNSFNAVAHYAKGAALFDAKKELENSKKELELALEVQEYFPAALSKLGDILFEKKEWAEGCQQYAQALMQMKTLQAPREQLVALRDRINDRLKKDARQGEMAKAWMKETEALVR